MDIGAFNFGGDLQHPVLDSPDAPGGNSAGAFGFGDPFTWPVAPGVATSDDSCSFPTYTAAPGSTLGGSVSYGDKPTAVIPAAGAAKVVVGLKAPSGRPAVLTQGGYCGTAVPVAKAAEVVTRCPSADLTAEVGDDGTSMTFTVPEGVYNSPGVYDLEGRATDARGNYVATARAYLYVEPSLFSTEYYGGLPTIDEVREAIRDYPDANRLLGDYEFSPGEIAGAVRRSVQRFNSAPPYLGDALVATTVNWPRDAKGALMDGVLAELFDVAAAYHRRGHLPYSAGGLSVDDLAKEKDYTNASSMYRQRWDWWVKMTRQRVNMEAAFGTIGSPYGW